MWTSSRRSLAAAAAAVLVLSWAGGTAHAQGSLGGQRAGTSSATFLRIGVGARAVGMGETFVAVANDPSAVYWNPAGLASLQRRELSISHVQWPADVTYEHLTLVLPSRRLGGYHYSVNLTAHSAGDHVPHHFEIADKRPERILEAGRFVLLNDKMREPRERVTHYEN